MEALIVAMKVLVIAVLWPVMLIDAAIEGAKKYDQEKAIRCERALDERAPGDTATPKECK